KIILLSMCCLGFLAGCETAQDQLGLTKEAPDEFKVVKRAPLELPPSYTLRPPAPGAPRPQEQATIDQARQTVFGGEDASAEKRLPTNSEGALLREAGAGNADPNIRRKVDEETANLEGPQKPVIDKILNLGSKDTERPGTVVDAAKEAERLEQNKAAGKPVTEGETPSIEQ
ncbi:MAG: DUF3035 domain-containing protein, partial [Pseudomonadota bacterium]